MAIGRPIQKIQDSLTAVVFYIVAATKFIRKLLESNTPPMQVENT